MPTPLYKLFHAYHIKPNLVEKIQPIHWSPKWAPKVTKYIATNKDLTTKDEEQDHLDICIYSDGSGIERYIGGTAVLFRNGRPKHEAKYQLSTPIHHTVFEGKLISISLGIELLCKETTFNSTSLYLDNQAAIQAMTNRKPSSGHYLMDCIHEQIKCV
jgi:hypothetical protein